MSSGDDALRRAQETMRRLQHEVRTPISQIVGYSELVEEELGDRGADDLAPDLRRIRTAAQRLLDLVDGKLRTEEDPGAPPLPDEAPAAAVREGEAEPPLAESDSRPLVLVVEHEPDDRELLVRRLEKNGYRVETARDGIDALRRIEEGGLDLVLLEVLMPGMSGLEVLERARRHFSRAELPIVIATSLGDSADTVEALERGANDYVTKPFDFPVVLARVQAQLETHRTARQVAALARQLEFRSAFIRQALGRDVSDELLVEMAERPGAFDLADEGRPVWALVADVRGTRERSASLALAQQAAVLQNTLGALCSVVEHYDGLVDAIRGDALVAVFGLPLARDDDAERAVACGVALQLEVDEINARAARSGLPPVEIGVGIAAGEVLVLGFGSGDAVRYEAMGEPLLRASALEAAARGGEVWICAETRARLGDVVIVDRERKLSTDAGGGMPEDSYRVVGLGGSRLISLRRLPAD